MPHLIVDSACPDTGPDGPGRVRLTTVAAHGDTLVVVGETVAEHMQRYVCRAERRAAPAASACQRTARQ